MVSKFLGYVDAAAHTLHLPARLQVPICHAYDWSLGCFDD